MFAETQVINFQAPNNKIQDQKDLNDIFDGATQIIPDIKL